jgi:phage baseplate assembly protein W
MSDSINIGFPFRNNNKGLFLDMNEDDNSAIKSDLTHLLLTQKGQRYYSPDFGTNLRKYLFEPNDDITHTEIKTELNETVKKYIPNLTITNLEITRQDSSEYLAVVKFDYTISEGVFESNDQVVIYY